jgi:hypothetical protein
MELGFAGIVINAEGPRQSYRESVLCNGTANERIFAPHQDGSRRRADALEFEPEDRKALRR